MLKLAANSDIGRFEDLVYELLDNYRGLRDNVGELYLACIMRLRGRDYIEKTSLLEFFTKDDKNLPKIPSMSSVIRLSTKLQKLYPTTLKAREYIIKTGRVDFETIKKAKGYNWLDRLRIALIKIK